MPKPTTTQNALQQRIALCMRQLCRGGAITPQTEQLYHTLLRTEFELKLLWLCGEKNKEQGVRTVESEKPEAGSLKQEALMTHKHPRHCEEERRSNLRHASSPLYPSVDDCFAIARNDVAGDGNNLITQ